MSIAVVVILAISLMVADKLIGLSKYDELYKEEINNELKIVR